MPLDGLWLRAPYLHNGSVPTLRDLLKPAAARPKAFWRGDDVYDPVNVGFVTNVPAREGVEFFRYDTTVPGKSNAGHEGAAFGTALPEADKDALVSVIKSFSPSSAYGHDNHFPRRDTTSPVDDQKRVLQGKR